MSDFDKKKKIDVEEDDETIVMTYDDGTQEEFYLIAQLDYEDKWYAYLQPVEETEDFSDDEVLIMEIAEDEEGNEIFLPVEDDELLNKLIDELNDSLAEDDGETDL